MEERLKRKWFSSGIYQLGSIEKYLEEMSQQGLEFVMTNGCFMYFREGEPRVRHYSLQVIKSAGTDDAKSDACSENEVSAYEEQGWHLVQMENRVGYFVSEEAHPADIDGDPAERLQNIGRNFKAARSKIVYLIVWLLLLVITMSTSYEIDDGTTGLVAANTAFCSVIVLLLIAAYALIKNGSVKKFCRLNEERIKAGGQIEWENYSQALRNSLTFGCVLAAAAIAGCTYFINSFVSGSPAKYMVLIVMTVLLVLMVVRVIRFIKAGFSRKFMTYFPLALVLAVGLFVLTALPGSLYGSNKSDVDYTDESGEITVSTLDHYEIPMVLDDLQLSKQLPDYKYQNTEREDNRSVFATFTACSQEIGVATPYDSEMALYYTAVKSHMNWALDTYENRVIKDGSYGEWEDVTAEEGSIWNASKVMRPKAARYSDVRLVRWSDKVLFIQCTDLVINKQNAETIARKLFLIVQQI